MSADKPLVQPTATVEGSESAAMEESGWVISKHSDPQCPVLYVGTASGRELCVMYTDEGIKKAPLFAAAPDLLKALKRARQGLSNLMEFGVVTGGYKDDALKEIEQFDAAISKAEGRS